MEAVCRGILLGQTAPADVTVRDGKIVAMRAPGRNKTITGTRTSHLAPTLFDIQVNGAGGIDLQSPELVPEDIPRITRLLAAKGVSRWVPTVMTGSAAGMERACRTIAEAMRDPVTARAVPGLHIEGPYISPLDGPRGAHSKAHVRNPDLREFARLRKAADGKVLYITLAPELPGAVEFIRAVVREGVVVSLGHHAGDADQIARAVDAGARLSTHLGNGLASNIHRHHNPLWPQLADDRLASSLIADLEHLPAPLLKTLIRAKGPERIVLTSDCVHLSGLPPGNYHLGDQSVELLPSGRICLSGTDLLAGSSLMLLQGVVNAACAGGMTLEQAVASATTIPGKLLGLRRPFNLPKPGAKADFILFDVNKGKAHVRTVFIDGERIC